MNSLVQVEPRVGMFTSVVNSRIILKVHNTTDGVLAYKIKCSNNRCFRVRPVFDTLDPCSSSQVELLQFEAPRQGRHNSIVVQVIPCEAGVHPERLFRVKEAVQEIVVPLVIQDEQEQVQHTEDRMIPIEV